MSNSKSTSVEQRILSLVQELKDVGVNFTLEFDLPNARDSIIIIKHKHNEKSANEEESYEDDAESQDTEEECHICKLIQNMSLSRVISRFTIGSTAIDPLTGKLTFVEGTDVSSIEHLEFKIGDGCQSVELISNGTPIAIIRSSTNCFFGTGDVTISDGNGQRVFNVSSTALVDSIEVKAAFKRVFGSSWKHVYNWICMLSNLCTTIDIEILSKQY